MTKTLLLFLTVALIAAAYVAGRWPERQRRLTLEGEVRMLERRIDDAEARVRMATLLGELQNLLEVAAQKNYGQAPPLSSRFFDSVRAESSRTPQPAFRNALERVLATRDPVTVALAQGEPVVLDHLRRSERHLKSALGWAQATPSPEAAPTPAPEENRGP